MSHRLVIDAEMIFDHFCMETHIGRLKLKAKVWVDEKSIANVISFADITDQYRVVYDNHVEDAFVIYVDPDDPSKTVKFARDINTKLYDIPFRKLLRTDKQMIIINTEATLQ